MEDAGTGRERARTSEERERITRFISALNQAMVVNGYSQRRLAAVMGVESGTFTKYIKGTTDPLRVGSGIQRDLANALGVTLDSLLAYYQTGRYLNQLNADAVESWIRSEAAQEDLPELLQALMEAGDRWLRKPKGRATDAGLPAYSWPREALDALGLPGPALERLGITEDALAALESEGFVSDALVDGMAVLLQADPAELRQALEERVPLPQKE